jgi:hypothetical protein
MRNTLFPLLALTAALAAVPAGSAVDDREAIVGQRLASDAEEFLDRLVGPGRSKVLVEVEGEVSEVHTQREINQPIYKEPDKTEEGPMPGYLQTESGPQVESYQKEMEILKNTASFRIQKITVAVVLDRTVPKEQENTIRRIFPPLMRMNSERGDQLTVLRADLAPPWKTAWMSPDGLRTLMLFAGIAALVFFVCLWVYITAMSAVRAFTAELAARRGAAPGAPPGAPVQMMPPGPEEAIDLGGGGLPSLTGEDEEPSDFGGGELPQIGRRFDFLLERDPEETGEMLAAEKSEDLALLFAYLSETDPERSSRLFSHLSPELQAETSRALMSLKMADPERLAMLESRLKTNVEFGVRGHDRLGRILSRMPLDEREGLLGELMAKDPEAAEAVERAVFPFEAIADLKTTELRRLIMAVPYEDWGAALRGVSESVVEKVLNELPAGTRNIVKEATTSPQPREKVQEARSKVLQQVYALAEKGQISIGRPGQESEMI